MCLAIVDACDADVLVAHAFRIQGVQIEIVAGHGPACSVVRDELRGILPDGVVAKATCGVARHTSGWYPEPPGVEDGYVDHPVVRSAPSLTMDPKKDRHLLGVKNWLRDGRRMVSQGERKWFCVPSSGTKS